MGIRSRLLLMLALVLGLGGISVGWLLDRVTQTHFRMLIEQENRGGDAALEQIAVELGEAFARGGWDALARTLNSDRESDATQRLLVIGNDGERYWSPSPIALTIEEQAEGKLKFQLDDAARGNRFILLEHRENGQEIRANSQTVGLLYGIPLHPADLSHPQQQFLTQSRASLILMFGIFILAGLIFVYVLGRRITQPLQQLAHATERLAAGELGFQVTVLGTDEVGRLAADFNAMSQRLQRTESLRKQMVSDIAHELRTPLTGVRCTLESIRDGVISASDDELDGLYHEVLELQRLVEDLQELSLADACEIRLHIAPVALSEVLESAIGAIPFREHGVSWRIEASNALPTVATDARRLRQIMINLLQNALTHSPPDGLVSIRVSWDDTRVQLQICDQGPGVAVAELESIFERFYRTDHARERDLGGKGLGLAISRQLARLMGGQISASLSADGGLIVSLQLPRIAPEGER